jgi:hypothetical protein
MAHIVEFRVHASSRSGRSARHRAIGSAEIVIFPGVRYDRGEDAKAARHKGLGLKRDLIDLPD